MTERTRNHALTAAEAYVRDGGFAAELARRVAVRTESQKGAEALPELQRYLDAEMIPAFRDMGFECRVFENPVAGMGPVLLASRIEDPARPTVLGYGHGDVIRGQDDRWTKGQGPWTLARDGDRLYGRGTADNKGQHTINMAALRTVLETRGRLGFNAKVMIEMGEEAGSRGLRELLSAHREAFAADVFIGSDGPRVAADRPTVTLGARGVQNFDLVCDLRAGAHHSGNWGGLLANPAVILAHAIASITDRNGAIRIPEWLPPPSSPAVREVLAALDIAPGGDGDVAIDPDWGEPGLSPAERVYASSSFNVLAMTAGTPDSPVNAIPPSARAHCQLRYFQGVDDADVVPALQRHLQREGFDRVAVEPPPAANAGGFPAARTEPDHPWALWVRDSLTRTLGRPPAVLPSMGGSIGNDLFTDLLGLPAIWLPHSYPACSQHAPDEHVLVPVCQSAMQVMTGLYWDIGASDAGSA
jgi:acetylornithine deacetylase/succinyl-diaminopimelate desuccinylase-like protein